MKRKVRGGHVVLINFAEHTRTLGELSYTHTHTHAHAYIFDSIIVNTGKGTAQSYGTPHVSILNSFLPTFQPPFLRIYQSATV